MREFSGLIIEYPVLPHFTLEIFAKFYNLGPCPRWLFIVCHRGANFRSGSYNFGALKYRNLTFCGLI